jgi:hypothetical protein
MVLIIHPEILVLRHSKQTRKPQLGARNPRASSNSTQTQTKRKMTRTKMGRVPRRTTSRTASGTGKTPQINPWTIK